MDDKKTITIFKVSDEITAKEIENVIKETSLGRIVGDANEISELFDETKKMIADNTQTDSWKNAEITVCDSKSNEYIIKSGKGTQKFLVKKIEGIIKSIPLVKTSMTEEIYTKEITYDLIETIIAEKELTGTHKEQRDMIVLLEKAANYVKSEPEGKNKDWKNAKITIYDENNDKQIILSGTGTHKIVVNRCSDGHTIRVVH